jgi:uncharacterized protein
LEGAGGAGPWGRRVASLEGMSNETVVFDLASLRLAAGEGRRLELDVQIDPLLLGGESYAVEPQLIGVTVDVSRMTGHGYAMRLRFAATLVGPCMRCLQEARLSVDVEAREVDRPGVDQRSSSEELSSPYVTDELLDVKAWSRDAFVLAVPAKVLCREECAGLCPVCATDLNEAGPEHQHEQMPDPRWAKLRELKLD